MRYAPADRLRPLVLGLSLALLPLAGCDGDVSIDPPTASADSPAQRAGAAQQALDDLVARVSGSRAGTGSNTGSDTGEPTPTDLAATIARNAALLDVRGLRLTYVGADLGALDGHDRERFGDDAWLGSVRVSYRLPVDTGTTRMEVAMTFDPAGSGGVAVVAVGGHGDRSPLWLRGPVEVRRGHRTLVVAAASEERGIDYAALARRAVAQVGRVLPGWAGTLTVDVPASEEDLHDVLAAREGAYANIAAVTATVDGSLVPGSPVHVFVNPRVFGTLKRSGAQVVLTHEATHVAADGPFADMPTWLLEGFADYVALADGSVPVDRAAAQALARIRRDGLPRRLPSREDLEPTAGGLGTAYEEAWLACRYLAQRFGEDRLIAFYRAAEDGRELAAVFRAVLGVTQAEFVAGWRRDLARLAG